ncbi:MAG TPA: maleylpyruvate isomerase family mycothiol-dependent enzyme [Acidimicrobiales bacterium]|nr:maleylpyruvate isomerase family mycothiol-dependent enzyme [Acidimicrobiales bacterium]
MTVGADHREPVVDGLAEVWSSFAAACAGIGAAQWDLPTDCPGWTVKDQLAHVIGVERMVMGDEAPPPLEVVPDHVRNEFAALNEPWIAARRDTPGPDVLAEFATVTGRRLRELRALSPERFDVVGWSPVGEVPYREFLVTRVVDCWAHEQDARRALGRPGGRDGAGESAVLDRCATTMAYVVGKRVAPPDGTAVRFEVAGALGRRVPVVMDGGRAAVAPDGGPDDPTVALVTDQETFWRLGFGRVDADAVLASGQVRVDGDAVLGRRVLESMAFMG